jgi:hypothetical protein
MPLKVTSRLQSQSRSFNNSKMTDVQTFEVDAEFTRVNVGP